MGVSEPLNRSQLELLRAHDVRPVKRRGQNFLLDGNLARAIAADCLELGSDVLELGAGGGALTFPLLEAGATVTAVEVDRHLCDLLREETAGRERFRLVEADIARLDWSATLDLAGPRPVVAGNLPYVLTSEVLFALIDHRRRVAGAVFMIQREVAARLAAGPGSKEYGVLAVVLGSQFEVEVRRQVPAAVFWPRPDVVSAVVVLRPRPDTWDDGELSRFRALVKGLFQQRRKRTATVLRALCGVDEAAAAGWCRAAGVDPDARPEQAPRAALRELARLIPGEDVR